jgi:Integrase zinc binding domain
VITVTKLVIPPERKLEILKKEHDEAAHLGFYKTFGRVRLRYYWPRMSQEIRKYVAQCETCKASKPLTTCQTPPIHTSSSSQIGLAKVSFLNQ